MYSKVTSLNSIKPFTRETGLESCCLIVFSASTSANVRDSCAGTYGHYLLHVDPQRSGQITDKIDHGDLSEKPGWVRLSIHPTTTDEEVRYLLDAVATIVAHGVEWGKDYVYSPVTNEFGHARAVDDTPAVVRSWFGLGGD